MKKQYSVKIQTKQGGKSSALTTTVMANSSADAKADVKKRYPGCTVISCTLK